MSRQKIITKPILQCNIFGLGRIVPAKSRMAMVSISHSSVVVDAPRSPVVTGLLWTLVLVVALLTALAALADRFWVGDMVTFFRPPLALAVLLLLCAAVRSQRLTASMALGALLLVNALPLFVTSFPTAAFVDAANLRIVSANVLYDNSTPERFGEVMAELSPDIIVVQEARYGWPDVLKTLQDFPNQVGQEVLKWNGNLVLSRYPMRANLVADMPPSGNELGGARAIRVEVDLPRRDRPLIIYAIHAPTPRTFVGWKARNRYLEALAEKIATEPPGATIFLAGDWNVPVWSPAYARTLLLSGLEATERSAWPRASRLFASLGGMNLGTPIDHVGVSNGIGVAAFFTGPDFGSDHLPVVVDLKLP